MRGKDPFQKPDFESDRDRLRRVRGEVVSRLRETDSKSANIFELCSILSIGDQAVIASCPKSAIAKLPRYVTSWENTMREVLGRLVVLVVRTEG